MKQPKYNQIEIVILVTGWLVFSILTGLMVAFDELEASAATSASTALVNAIKTGFLLFLAGLPIYGPIYLLSCHRSPWAAPAGEGAP